MNKERDKLHHRIAERSNEHHLALISQVLSSGRSVLFALSTARALDADAFGVISFVVLFSLAVNGLLRAAAAHPLALVAHSESRLLSVAVTYFVLLASVIAAPAALIAGVSFERPVLALGLLLYPFVAAQDAVRVCSLNLGLGKVAVLVDGTWLVLLAGALISLHVGDQLSSSWVLLAWAATAFAAASIGIPRRQFVDLAALRSYRERTRKVGREMTWEVLFETIPTRIMPLVAVSLLSVEAAGSLRGAETVLGGTAIVWSALSLSSLRSARSNFTTTGMSSAFRHVSSTMSWAFVALAGNVALLLLSRDLIGVWLLGDAWDSARAILVPVALLLGSQITLGICSLTFRSALLIPEGVRMNMTAAALAAVTVPIGVVTFGLRGGLAADAGSIFIASLIGLRRIRILTSRGNKNQD